MIASPRIYLDLTICLFMKKYRIRRLTPRECFRLMGMREEDIDKLLASGISESQLYKLAGNSIVEDVLFYIFGQMFFPAPSEAKLF